MCMHVCVWVCMRVYTWTSFGLSSKTDFQGNHAVVMSSGYVSKSCPCILINQMVVYDLKKKTKQNTIEQDPQDVDVCVPKMF